MAKKCRSCCGGATACGTFWVVSQGCSNVALPGTIVTVKQGTTTTGTAPVGSSQEVYQLNRTSGGTGYTNGTGYAITFTGGGGTGAAGTFDVVSGAVTNLVVTARGSGYTSAPTPSFPGAGSGSGATATAAIGYVAAVSFAATGSYTLTMAESSPTGRFATFAAVGVNATQCKTIVQTLVMSPSTNYVCVASFYACGPYPLAKTLHLSTPDGIMALTYTTSGTVGGWGGTMGVNVSGSAVQPSDARTCVPGTVAAGIGIGFGGTINGAAAYSPVFAFTKCINCSDNKMTMGPGSVTGSYPGGFTAISSANTTCVSSDPANVSMSLTCSATPGAITGSFTITGVAYPGTYLWTE